ncbi:MAG: cytochrome P450, partial [Pseudonocardia sp.]
AGNTAHRDNPYPLYKSLRDNDPVIWDPQLDAYVVSRFETCAAIMLDAGTYSSEGSLGMSADHHVGEIKDILSTGDRLGTVIVESDGETHARLHRIWSQFFHGPRINGRREAIQQLAARFADDLATKDQVDLVEDFARPFVLSVISGLMMGLPEEDWERAYQQAINSVVWATPWLPMESRIAAAEAHVAADPWYRELWEQRKAAPMADDIPSLSVHLGEPYEEFIVSTRTIYTAAVDTTVGAITSGVMHLLRNGMWERAAHSERFVANAVEETLRHTNPLRGLLRTTTRPVELDGVPIEANQKIWLLFGSANRDERKFPEADVFDPDRPSQQLKDHIGFGVGIHACLGANLAHTEARAAIRALATRYPDMSLPADFTPTYSSLILYQVLTGLEVTLR